MMPKPPPISPHRRRLLVQGGAGAAAIALPALAALPGAARAQQQPAQTVIWSGFPPGGLGDQVTRPLLDRMKGRWSGTMILDAKPGAGGRIAADHVKRAAPDGATLLQTPSSIVTIYPHIYAKLPYNPLTDFVAVAPLCTYAISFTAGPGLPAEIKTLAEYLKWARDNPAKANYGIPAAGSALHFGGMLLARASGVALNNVPYRGGGPLLQDLLGGQVPVSFNVVSEVQPHVKAGRLRTLAVTSPQRWPGLPDAPTMAEAGFKEIDIVEFLGWYAPAGTSGELVGRLNTAVSESIKSPEMAAVLDKIGLQPLTQPPAEFAKLVRAEHDRWAGLVKATGFKAEE
jgi:tripartite-type tricarboxylate transporter receptor subunit TctC